MRKNEPHTVFDGFCERGYDGDTDGWIMEQLEDRDVPSVQMAKDILSLYAEVNALRKENWRLKKAEKEHNDYLARSMGRV